MKAHIISIFFFDFLGDQHRVFLQGMLTRGMVNSKELDELYDISLARCDIPVTENRIQRSNDIKRFLRVIGDNIVHLGLQLVKIKDEESTGNKAFITLVNRNELHGDSKKNAMLTFNQNELAYLKIVVRKVMQSEMKQISAVNALNCVGEMGQTSGKRFRLENISS